MVSTLKKDEIKLSALQEITSGKDSILLWYHVIKDNKPLWCICT